MMKAVFVIFMLTATSSWAIEWDNDYTVNAVCDNSTMYVNVNFTSVFQGAVYQSRGYYNPKCSYMVPYNKEVMEVDLPLSFNFCDIQIEEMDNRTVASTEVVIQMHTLLDSIYDRTVNVSCEILYFQAANVSDSGDSNPYEALGLDHSWIEFKNGLVLFGEVGESIESTLFLVVNVRDDDSNKDMMVQNCVAHTDRNVTNTTIVTQLSDVYGCPNSSFVFPNFTVVHPENNHASMFAYAPVVNFSLVALGGKLSVSCGITICESSCPNYCNDTASPTRLPLSDYVTKDIVMRNGIVMPDSLRDLNRHNDRSQRTVDRPKRSFTSFFTRIFQWESRVVNESVSGGNLTNITSIGITKGLVVKSGIFAKDVLKPVHKHIGINPKTMDSDFIEDKYLVDGQTVRFISLMTICMFITVLACYCCYAGERQKSTKGRPPFVF